MSSTLERSPSRAMQPDALRLIDAYWRAANYVGVGQLYLRDNPLLRTLYRKMSNPSFWGIVAQRQG